MRTLDLRIPRLIFLASLGALTACSSSGSGDGAGSTLGNLFRYGSTTEPPVAGKPAVEAAECPGVLVTDGRAAIRTGSNQVSIANVARECVEREGGAIAVKVGVEGRALLGPGGSTARFDVPVSFVLKRGDRILASRVRRISVAIPPGEVQASFIAVEGDLIVPPGTGEYDIEVGLGGSAPAGKPASRKRS